MQGGILWTVHAVLIGMFRTRLIACFTLFVFCLKGGYSWPNSLRASELIQLVPLILEWWPNKCIELLLSQSVQE